MKTYLREKLLCHVKTIIIVFIVSTVYVFVSLNGWKGIVSPYEEEDLMEIEMKQDGEKIFATIPKTENLVLDISELSEKQETVKLYFYNQNKEIIKEKSYVLRVGPNNIGSVNEDLVYIKYQSNRDISVDHIYITQGYYINWGNVVYVVLGLFLLGMMYEGIVIIKTKYAN